jgi:hypothetical protein
MTGPTAEAEAEAEGREPDCIQSPERFLSSQIGEPEPNQKADREPDGGGARRDETR